MKTKAMAMAAATLAVACGANNSGAGGGAGGASGATVTSSATSTGTGSAGGLVAHEWGTFTSVQSALGETMDGMAHEDEPLPTFVYGRADYAVGACDGCAKQLEYLPTGVKQKLETPVIYFYGNVGDVSVHVDFPKGVISQWFPQAASFAPAVDPKKTGTPLGGAMGWAAKLDPALGDKDFPLIDPTNIWAPSRKVPSVPVRVMGSTSQAERFIFYRGVGAFDTDLHVVSTGQDVISIKNGSPDNIAGALLLRVHKPDGVTLMGKAVPLGPLAANATLKDIVLPFEGKELVADYVNTAVKQLKAMLVTSGLSDAEAQAMVDTWDRSYFKIEGVRILYIVPRTWTDALLPITITPAPQSLVRTLVGRVEVLTLAEEQNIVNLVKAYAGGTKTSADVLTALGRFAEPKLRRGAQLVAGDTTLTTKCAELVTTASQAK